jgi:hypothetical protein
MENVPLTAGMVGSALVWLSSIIGACFAISRFFHGKVRDVEKQLDEYKIHVAETFATKQGMQEQTGQLLRAIEGVGNRIDGMSERLDRAFERTVPSAPTRRSRSNQG